METYYTKMKRGIAGSLVQTLFDRDPMHPVMRDPSKHYYAHRDEINWLQAPVNVSDPNLYDIYGGVTDPVAQQTIMSQSLTEANRESTAIYGGIVDAQAVTVRREAVYADQIMPFDITLVAQNE